MAKEMQETGEIWYKKWLRWLTKNENIHYVIRFTFMVFAIAYFSIELGNVWQPIFNKYIVPYLFINNGWGNTLMILCSIATLIWIIFITYYKTRINWRKTLPLLAIVLFLYVYFRFFSNIYDFLPLEWQFKYLDWGIILIGSVFVEFIAIEIVSSQNRKNKKELEVYYLYDNAINSEEQDILDISSKAHSAAKEIQKFDTSEHSWSIGITGKWGAGKTSYINLILQNLPTKDYEIIKFFPRSSKDITTIQEDALNLLSERLKIYHLGLSTFFKEYIYALRLIDSKGWIDTISSSFQNINVQNKKNILIEALKCLPKKVVFVIDDFDRLTQNEIIEVLKLLDNNANFPNVIYITAYDKQYVKKQFEQFSNYQGESCFVDKFFNVEWNIPLRQYYNIYNYIISQLRTIVDTTQFGYDISEISTIGYYSDIFQKHIPTMRDAKRLINLFQSDYQVVRGEVDVIDFLLLSIIKYRFRDEYSALFRLEYLINSSNNTLAFSKEKSENIPCKDIVERLFGANEASRRPRRIYQRESFYNYFVDHINNTLRLPQLAELFTMDFNKIEATIKEWSVDAKAMSELLNYIDSRRQQIESAEELFKYIDIVLLYNGYSNSDSSAVFAKQVVRIPEIISEYKNRFLGKFNQDILYKHLVEYFNKKLLLMGDISLLRDMYLATEDQQNNLLLFKEKEINAIIVRHFNEYAKETNSFDDYGINLLYACINHVNPSNRHIILEKACCNTARGLIEKYPEYYFDHFVRLQYISSDPQSNAITCEPFWKQIFGDSERIYLLIFSKKMDKIKNINRVRNFWRIYMENNYMPIEFTHQGNVQNIINNNLEIQINQLNTLKKYESDLKEMILNPEDTMNFSTHRSNKAKIENMKQHIDNISLNIFLKSKLIRDIEHITVYVNDVTEN